MNEDDDIDDAEKEYLGTLVNTFGLDADQIEESIAFAQNPDDEVVMEMLKAFKSKDVKYSFMMDCLMIANADGNFDESEEVLIEQFFELYEISIKEKNLLVTLFEKFQTKDPKVIYDFFSENEDKKNLFGYLLNYYKIDLSLLEKDNEVAKETKKQEQEEFFRLAKAARCPVPKYLNEV